MREMKLMVALGSELKIGMRVLHGAFAEQAVIGGYNFGKDALGTCIFLKVKRIKPVDPFNSLVYFEGDHQPSSINDDEEVLVAEIVADVVVPLGKGRMVGDV